MTRGVSVRRRRGVALAGALVVAATFLSRRALAFDSKGHVVVEALAYRTLIEGREHEGIPPRPDVLRDLFNDGALYPPICFGLGPSPPAYCGPGLAANPLLDWPRPLTDQPDAAFRRQFSDPGQCFHFMATLEDAQTESLPGTDIPRGLATSAIIRCRDLMRVLVHRIVVDGGPATRRSAYGLYELMHAIGDSFSEAHSARRAGGLEIEYLRVWKPLERIARIPRERSASIPASAFHGWDEERDREYVVRDRSVPSRPSEGSTADEGHRPCRDLVGQSYEVPFECLSERGDQARRALVELLVVVRDLRLAHVAAMAGGAADPAPEASAAWRTYEDKWFAPAHPCRAEECGTRQPPDPSPGAYELFGLATTYNFSTRAWDTTGRATLLRYASDLNPFIYVIQADLGYRRSGSGESLGVAGLSLDLAVPLGKRVALGITPGAWRIAFNGAGTSGEFSTRLFRFDTRIGERLFLTFNGPLEVNWRRPAVEWALGLGVTWAPGRSQNVDEERIRHAPEAENRHDDSWAPPPAPFGRLSGRRATIFAGIGGTTVNDPPSAIPGTVYGLGTIGGLVLWDRDRWGQRFEWTPALSLAIGARRTSGESEYLTGILGMGLRWYPLRILGLSVTPIRIEGGIPIRGADEADSSPGVHGDPGSKHYFEAGSRIGIAFTAGLVDLVMEGPTIAWRSKPFEARETLSVSLLLRLD